MRERQGCHRLPLSRSTWAKCMPPGGGLRCRSVDNHAPSDKLPCNISCFAEGRHCLFVVLAGLQEQAQCPQQSS